MRQGLHIGAQVYASIDGRPVADFAIGKARPGVAMTPDSIMMWQSCGKPVTALALAQQWEKGRLGLDDRIEQHIPGFGRGGKEAVTIRHVLTHMAGFRWVQVGSPDEAWDRVIERIAEAPQEKDWVAGRTAGYSPFVSWFLLGEIVRRLDGREFGQYVREEILEPAGMLDSWLAMPPERYRDYGDRIGVLQRTGRGTVVPVDYDNEKVSTHCRPGGGMRGPVRELGRFFETLLAGGIAGSTRLALPQTIEAMTARHRTGVQDVTFNHIVDFGLGLIVNSAQYGADTVPYGFGPISSPRTFGHGGAQAAIAFADPQRRLVVAIVCNGLPGEAAHQARMRAVLEVLERDLGTADE
jgi:CubicO group peptidase (beta-lactamase class C family)